MNEPGKALPGQRDGSVEAFRWICILAVLVHHSVFPSRQSVQVQEAIHVAKEWLSWCVTGFFFVSGWLSRPESFGPRGLAERARRLLVPFLCVNLVVLLTGIVLVRLGAFAPPPGEEYSLDNLARQMVYLQGMGPQYYFLPSLLIVGAVAMAIARFAGRSATAVGFGVLALVFCAVHGAPSTPYGGGLDRFPLYLAMFSLGMALRQGPVGKLVLTVVVCGLAEGGLFAATGKGTALLHAFLPVLLFAGVRLAVGNRPLAILSRWNSGAVYLWHAPFVHPASSIACHKLGLPGGVEFLMTVAVTVAICQAIHLGLSKAGLGRWLSL